MAKILKVTIKNDDVYSFVDKKRPHTLVTLVMS